jgi:hypothetical protein
LDVLNAEHERVAGMVDDLGRVMAALGERADAIRLLSRRAKAASEAIASRDVALGQALEELPTTVTQVDSTTGRLARFSRSATPVLRNMGQGFRQLAPAVRTLQPAAAAGRRTMAALDRFATRATPLTGDLRGFATRAVDLPPALKRFLNEYRPFVAYLAPYAGDVGSFFALNRLASELVSGPGKVLRVLFTISEDSYGATRGEERRALDALIETGLVTKVHTVGVNPYPAPGTVGHPRPFDGHYPRVKVDR